MKGSLIIISFFVLGIITSYFSILPEFLLNDNFSNYILYILMLFVGISIGLDKRAFKIIKQVKLKILLVPLSTIVGTLLGVAIFSIFISDVSLKNSLAIGSGFGYYSISSILITKMSGETMGVIALVSNIIREIITLLLTPFFAKYFGKLAPISSGGATSMDTTLPIITRSVGKEYAMISIFHGTILTIIVPFLVTFILG